MVRVLFACLAFSLASCSLFRRERGVSFATDPPGAKVVLDGKDTGFVTPCLLYVSDDNGVKVDLVRPGYETAHRVLNDRWTAHTILWNEMSVHYNTWDFPLFLNFEDFFIFLKVDDEPIPARIFVRLRREADQ
jgi:hypothetical protein